MRMQNVVDPTVSSRYTPSCNVTGRGLAFPPRRIVQTAKEIQLLGGTGLVRSICQDDYSGLVDALLRALAPLLTPL